MAGVTGVLALVALLSWGGCKTQGPGEAFEALAEAEQKGDQEAFLEYLMPDSRAVMELILSNRATYPKILPIGGGKSVRAVEVKLSGELAYVVVESGHEPPELAIVVMRQWKGKWRLDLLQTALEWNRDWRFSGAAVPEIPPLSAAPPGSLDNRGVVR